MTIVAAECIEFSDMARTHDDRVTKCFATICMNTAAERDRLKAINAELVAALERAVSAIHPSEKAWTIARSAIAKARGET